MGANSKKVILVCDECLSRNYSITKSAIGQRERIVIKKHCMKCNKHTVHKETR